MTKRQMIISSAILVILIGFAVLLPRLDPTCCASDVDTQNQLQDISPSQYQTQFMDTQADHILIDVRTPGEFAEGNIPGAINISIDSLESRLSEIPNDKPVIVYCRSGNRSAVASEILAQAGYNDIYDLGGIIAWNAAGLPVE